MSRGSAGGTTPAGVYSFVRIGIQAILRNEDLEFRPLDMQGLLVPPLCPLVALSTLWICRVLVLLATHRRPSPADADPQTSGKVLQRV